MIKQNSVTVGFEDRAEKTGSSGKPVQTWVNSKLLGMLTILTGSIRRPRRPIDESYIPRKSPGDESRLEFQRFLYW